MFDMTQYVYVTTLHPGPVMVLGDSELPTAFLTACDLFPPPHFTPDGHTLDLSSPGTASPGGEIIISSSLLNYIQSLVFHFLFPVWKSKPVANTGIHLRKSTWIRQQKCDRFSTKWFLR